MRVLAINDSTVRRGTIEINGNKIRFSLFGDFGLYGRDGPLQSMSIDRVGAVPQRYENYERYLNLFDKSYAFAIDPRGASLSLTPLAERRPDRPLLTVGSQAPEFVATNINGAKLSLPQYRGRMLLVEFWSIFCEPCRYETPQMVSFYRSTRRQDLEFLGVADDAPEADLRQFLSANGMKWTQIREPWSGNVHRLFRVEGMPTYFLIGRTGEILATWIGAGKAVSALTKFLPASK